MENEVKPIVYYRILCGETCVCGGYRYWIDGQIKCSQCGKDMRDPFPRRDDFPIEVYDDEEETEA